MENGDFKQIRKIIQDIAIIQDQQAKMLLRHSKIRVQHDERMAEHDERMAEHDERMAEHDERMAEHDERMDRVGRHLEVLANITDSLIRDKAGRKKR